MADRTDRVIALLESIDASLKRLASQQKKDAVAPDRDLDGPYGNPEVKFNPRDWSQESCKGRRMSECPAPFLDLLAETFEYFATKAEATDERTTADKPVADYKRQDAARARGWAKRVREGRVPEAPAADSSWGKREDEGDF